MKAPYLEKADLVGENSHHSVKGHTPSRWGLEPEDPQAPHTHHGPRVRKPCDQEAQLCCWHPSKDPWPRLLSKA